MIRTSLVGRVRERDALAALVTSVVAGRGHCMFLVGEAGVGKTRLLTFTREEASARGVVVLEGAGPSAVSTPAFGVLAQALRAWTRTREPARERLAAYAPGLRLVLPEWPAPAASDLSDEQRRLLAPEAVLQLLRAVAGARGVLVLIDDLHAADPETLAFVQHAAPALARERIALVCTVRVPEGRDAEAEARGLARRGHAEVIDVGPLARDEVRELILSLGASDDTDSVFERSAGIPLLVEAAVEQHGSARGVLTDLVRARLARLGHASRETIRAAAILGRFAPELLARMTGLDVPMVNAALREARDVGLLDQGGTSFRHGLMRDAVAAELVEHEREALHRSAAAAIAALGDDPQWLAERAGHLEAIGEDAAPLYVDAGERSLAAGAPLTAERWLRRALGLARTETVADRARDALATALSVLGRWDESLRLDRDMPSDRGADPVRLVRMARCAAHGGRLDEAETHIARALELHAPPAPLRALEALVALWRGDVARARDSASQAVALSHEARDPGALCAALDVLGRASDSLGERDAARDAFERWADVAARSRMPASRAQALVELGNMELFDRADPATLYRARDEARAAGALVTQVLAGLSLAWCTYLRSELDAADASAAEAVDICRRHQLDLLPHALQALAAVTNARRWHAGDALLDEARSLAPDDLDIRVQDAELRGELALREGRLAEVVTICEPALEIQRANRATVPGLAPVWHSFALVALDRRAEAREAAAEMASLRVYARAPLLMRFVDAASALADGDAAAFDRALEAAAPLTHYAMICRVLGSSILRDAASVDRLRSALAHYADHAGDDDAARVRRLLRELGAPVARARPRSSQVPPVLREHGVSPREAEVLALVVAGLSNAEIARRLSLSERTIESHVSSLLTKLDARNRVSLVARTATLGPRGAGERAKDD